jgi:PAS domain S-box-containing protein
MKNSIGRKLMASGLIVLIFMLLVIATNQIVVRLFDKTSTNLVVEYHELDAIQEFKLALGKLQIFTNTYAVFGDDLDKSKFDELVLQARERLSVCIDVVTEKHEVSLFNNFEDIIFNVDSMAFKMFQISEPRDENRIKILVKGINQEITNSLNDIDILLNGTKFEINEYEEINSTVIRHSTITVFTLGIIIILILGFGGIIFIKSLTKPINELVNTTIKISQGDRSAKVNTNLAGEFQTLAGSFNQMIDTLEQTTVSKDYLKSILNNMFNALIVTDNQLKIRSVNQAALSLLGFRENEFINQDISILFDKLKKHNIPKTNIEKELFTLTSLINTENHILTKSGKKIPALLSCAVFKNRKNEPEGLIIVGHDLTEKNAIERKLEQTRKERLIDINEAQEKERLRIATDLHDGLGQMLTAISYSVQNLYPKDTEADKTAHDALNKIQQQIDATIREAKNLAQNLIPIVLKDFGLIVAIKNMIGRANEMHETKFRFDAFDFDERIDTKLEKALYRICQETLNNIVKHAGAKNAYYQIYWQDCCVALVIEDDGVGFDTKNLVKKSKNAGLGLMSIRERVLAFDGNFTIISEPGQGTEIVIEIPCRKNKTDGNS